MQIKRSRVIVTACDMCENTLTPTRVNGCQSYEGHDCQVCSGCCANPENSTDTPFKINFLIGFYEKSKALKDGIPPFWPIGDDGTKLDIEFLRALA